MLKLNKTHKKFILFAVVMAMFISVLAFTVTAVETATATDACTHPYNLLISVLVEHNKYSDGSCTFRWGTRCTGCGWTSGGGDLGFSNNCAATIGHNY